MFSNAQAKLCLHEERTVRWSRELFQVNVLSRNPTATSMPRRTALRFLLGTVVGSVASLMYPVLRYLVPPAESGMSASEALAGRIDELKPNSGKTFRFGSRPALLVRLASGEYRSIPACVRTSAAPCSTGRRRRRFGAPATTVATTERQECFRTTATRAGYL